MHARRRSTVGVFAILSALCGFTAHAASIQTIFVIAMENYNWTQPANQFTGTIQQIYQNPNALFINSLVNGTAFAVINGQVVHISSDVAYATAYHNVLATPSGNNPHIHPSEPNYLWAEAGTRSVGCRCNRHLEEQLLDADRVSPIASGYNHNVEAQWWALSWRGSQ